MSDPSYALQVAHDAVIRADTAVKTFFAAGKVRLFATAAPNGTAYPFIWHGEHEEIGDDTECARASEITCTFHVFAREATPADSARVAKELAFAVRKAVTKKLPLTGHVMDDWTHESTRHLTDPDGLTAHSVVTVTYLTTEAE